jgi:hypothetical protein
MKRCFLLALATVCVAAPASAQYIGIFMDTQASSCAAQVGPQPWVDLHVIAVLENSVTEMAGAQFQISGAPEGWTAQNVLWVPEPTSAISLGNPIFPTELHPRTAGVNVAFASCQTTSHVLLGRLVLLGAPTPANVHLRVLGFKWVPTDPPSPFVLICDLPMFSKVGVGGGEIVLNDNGPGIAGCQLAIEPRSWSTVKSLYQ